MDAFGGHISTRYGQGYLTRVNVNNCSTFVVGTWVGGVVRVGRLFVNNCLLQNIRAWVPGHGTSITSVGNVIGQVLHDSIFGIGDHWVQHGFKD